MQDIVKYHNDFNKVKLPSLTEQEQNIFFGIISKIKNKGENKMGRVSFRITPNEISYFEKTIKFTPQELLEFSTENLTNKALGNMLLTLREKIFKADFTMLIEKDDEDLIGKVIINLFETFTLLYPKNDTEYKNLLRVEMTIHPYFSYLVDELNANFTRFELAEFFALSGKYTKTIYRQLKQFRQTGWAEWDFNEFKSLLDIPESYALCDIDKQILKPALKELTQERNLFDTKRIPFKGLKYTKIKKGGNKVTAIRFEWTKEKAQELESKQEKKVESTNTSYPKEPNIKAYCGLHINIPVREGGKESKIEGKITNIYETNEKIIMEIIDENFNTTNLPFDNLEALEKCVKSFQI